MLKVFRMLGTSGILAIPLASLLLLHAIPATGSQSSNDQVEKRSMIQSVDGYSYLSEDKTIAELRDAALINAKQQALSNAATYIKSRTEVENFVLKSDEVLVNAEGTVKILEKKDNGIQDNSRYHVWIKAEVEYLLGDSGPAGSAIPSSASQAGLAGEPETGVNLPSPSAPLTVKIWSSKKAYRQGEEIKIYLKGNRDFYARIVDINELGEIIQLLPNDYRGSSFFKGGVTYKIPDSNDRFDLKVSPPFGIDRVVVYASEVPLGEVEMSSIGRGLSSFQGDQKSLAERTRGISVTAKKQDSGGNNASLATIAEFYEASYSITTSR